MVSQPVVWKKYVARSPAGNVPESPASIRQPPVGAGSGLGGVIGVGVQPASETVEVKVRRSETTTMQSSARKPAAVTWNAPDPSDRTPAELVVEVTTTNTPGAAFCPSTRSWPSFSSAPDTESA